MTDFVLHGDYFRYGWEDSWLVWRGRQLPVDSQPHGNNTKLENINMMLMMLMMMMMMMLMMLLMMMMNNFNTRSSHGHHGSKRREVAQHALSHGSHAFSHTQTNE